MATNCSQSCSTISKTLERVFEDAQHTGEIQLSCRKLRDYPKLAVKYDLVDTISADVSKNRLTEVPKEVCAYMSMEKLNCYHNVIKSIPESITQLQALTYLNISRNQLSNIPSFISHLQTLEVLIVSHNRLVSLPEEIGILDKLMELDVSCNQISHLPVQIGDLKSLKSLNVRCNLLQELPIELSKLNLRKLDISCNKISQIPTVFRKIETLEEIIVNHNPLTLPPAYVCTKGKQHIMKYLQIIAIREDKARLGMLGEIEMKRFRKSMPTAPSVALEEFHNYLDSPDKWKRHTVLSSDSGYSTTDSVDKCGWSPQEASTEPQHLIDSNSLATRSAAIMYRNLQGSLLNEPIQYESSEAPQRLNSRLSSDNDSSATLTPTTPPLLPPSVVLKPLPLQPVPPTLFPTSLQTLSAPVPQGPGPGTSGTVQSIVNPLPCVEDKFTRELQRQKQEYENKKKIAEQLRLQQEEEENEQRRQATQAMHNEQSALLDRQGEEAEAKRLEVEKIRAVETLRLSEEKVRKAEELKKAEDARKLEEIKHHRMEPNIYCTTNYSTLSSSAWLNPPTGTVSQHAACSPPIHTSQTCESRTNNYPHLNTNQHANDGKDLMQKNSLNYQQTVKTNENSNFNHHGDSSPHVYKQGQRSINQQIQHIFVPSHNGQNFDVNRQHVVHFQQGTSHRLNQLRRKPELGENHNRQQCNQEDYNNEDVNYIPSQSNQLHIPSSAGPYPTTSQQIISVSAGPSPTNQLNLSVSEEPSPFIQQNMPGSAGPSPPTIISNNASPYPTIDQNMSVSVEQSPVIQWNMPRSAEPSPTIKQNISVSVEPSPINQQNMPSSARPLPTIEGNISVSAGPSLQRQQYLSNSGSVGLSPANQQNIIIARGHVFMHGDNLRQIIPQASHQHNSQLSSSSLCDPAHYGHHGNPSGKDQHNLHNSMPLDSVSENRKSNLSSSSSFKEDRKPSESGQHYRRTASDSIQRLPASSLPVSNQQTHGAHLTNRPIDEQSRLNGTQPTALSTEHNPNLSLNTKLSESPHSIPAAKPTNLSITDNRPSTPTRLSVVQRPRGTVVDLSKSVKTVDNRAKANIASVAATVKTGLSTSKKGSTHQDDEVKNVQHPLKNTSNIDGPKVRADQRLRSIQKDAVQRKSSGSTSSEDDRKRPAPTHSTMLHNPAAVGSKRAGSVMTSAHVKMLDDYSKEANFTLQRHDETQKENHEQMEQLRHTISMRLKRSLPENLSEALSDGVLLCHLANQIRPRSVASVHVPSPAVPKLTPPKCRKNVENFLEACKKIGVPKDQICDPNDILAEQSLQHVAATVAALVAIATHKHLEASTV